MPKIEFYDVAKKKSFMTDKYKIVSKNGRFRAVAKAPSGVMASRFVSKDFAKKKK